MTEFAGINRAQAAGRLSWPRRSQTPSVLGWSRGGTTFRNWWPGRRERDQMATEGRGSGRDVDAVAGCRELGGNL